MFFNSTGGSPLKGNATVYNGGYKWFFFVAFLLVQRVVKKSFTLNVINAAYTHKYTHIHTNIYIAQQHMQKNTQCERQFLVSPQRRSWAVTAVVLLYISSLCSRRSCSTFLWYLFVKSEVSLRFVMRGLFHTTGVVKLNTKLLPCACQLTTTSLSLLVHTVRMIPQSVSRNLPLS